MQNKQVVDTINTVGDGGEVLGAVAEAVADGTADVLIEGATEAAGGFFSNLVENSLELLGGIFDGVDDAPGLAIAAVIGAGVLIVLAIAGIIWLTVKLVKKKK
jgi:hypothetical protein